MTDPELLGRADRGAAPDGRGHRRRAPPLRRRPGQLPRGSPPLPAATRVLALVTPMGPGGLRVDPIHRVVPDLTIDAAVARRGGGLPGHRAAPASGGDDVVAAVRRVAGERRRDRLPGHRRPPAASSWTTRRTRCCAAVPPEAPAAWRGLDVVLAHHGLLDLLWHRRDDPESVLIAHTVDGGACDRGRAERAWPCCSGRPRRPTSPRSPAPGRACRGSPRCSSRSRGPGWCSGPSRTDGRTRSRFTPSARPSRRPDRGTLRPRRQLTSQTDAVPVPVRQNRRCRAPSTSTTSPGCHRAARRCSDRS